LVSGPARALAGGGAGGIAAICFSAVRKRASSGGMASGSGVLFVRFTLRTATRAGRAASATDSGNTTMSAGPNSFATCPLATAGVKGASAIWRSPKCARASPPCFVGRSFGNAHPIASVAVTTATPVAATAVVPSRNFRTNRVPAPPMGAAGRSQDVTSPKDVVTAITYATRTNSFELQDAQNGRRKVKRL